MNNKILIIEDDIEISNMLDSYISKNNYDTYVARDGITGLSLQKKKHLI